MTEYTVVLPSRPRIVSEENLKGTYEIDGLYAGYGHTLGNSLRRIVLSSLPGAAVESAPTEELSYLKNLSLENLLDIEVSSVSKKIMREFKYRKE